MPVQWLESARIDQPVLDLRPDYRAVLIVADALEPGPSDDASSALLLDAEARAAALLDGHAPEELEPVVQWREAYRAFGAKPQRTRPSVEALLRRVDRGLPRVDRLTDAYNAVSITHLLPVGGEDQAGTQAQHDWCAQQVTSRSTPRATANRCSSTPSPAR